MAVLEKIRKRSVLLFIIIIGALLAFILGDFLNSGRTLNLIESPDTMAKVGKTTVKYNDMTKYQNLVENQSKDPRYYDTDARMLQDPDYRQKKALNLALNEKLLKDEYNRSGLNISSNFIQNLLLDPNNLFQTSQNLLNTIADNQEVLSGLYRAGIIDNSYALDVNKYIDAMNSPEQFDLDGNYATVLGNYWKEMENNISDNIKNSMYVQMVGSLIVPNKADAKAEFDNENTTATVEYARVNLSTVNNDAITIEETDYQKAYDSQKGKYQILEPYREIAYIVVPVRASAEDIASANKETEQLIAEVSENGLTEALKNHKGFIQSSDEVLLPKMESSPYSVFVNGEEGKINPKKGDIKEISLNGSKVVAYITDETSGYENIKYTIFPVADQHQADSLFVNKKAEAVDSVITDIIYSIAGNQGAAQLRQYVNAESPVIDPEASVITKNLAELPTNQYNFVTDSVSGQNFVMIVKERSQKVPAYKIARLTYDIIPSENTKQNLSQQLHSYIVNHPTAEQFANDSTGTYMVYYNMISANDYTIGDHQTTPNTRNLVKWAMDAKKGAVSPVFTRSITRPGSEDREEYLVALAVMDKFNNYKPINSHIVHEQLTPIVTNNKKAEYLIDKYQGKGKNAAEYATAMEVQIIPQSITFNSANRMRIGGEAQGVVTGAKKGDIVGPVQGANAVYVFEIKDVTSGDFDAVDTKTRIQEAQRTFVMPQDFDSMLIGNRKVVNKTLKHLSAADE